MTTGEKIKEIRTAKRISRDKLAALMNTTGITIYRLETGVMQITEEWLDRFARALKCRPSEIIDGVSKEQSSAIDPVRLAKSREAVEAVITERKLKLTNDQIAAMLAEVYNETLKYENQGTLLEPKIAAELLMRK